MFRIQNVNEEITKTNFCFYIKSNSYYRVGIDNMKMIKYKNNYYNKQQINLLNMIYNK